MSCLMHFGKDDF